MDYLTQLFKKKLYDRILLAECGSIDNYERLNHLSVVSYHDQIEPGIRIRRVTKEGGVGDVITDLQMYDLVGKAVKLEVFPVLRNKHLTLKEHQEGVAKLLGLKSLSEISTVKIFDPGLLTSFGFSQKTLLSLGRRELLKPSKRKVRRFGKVGEIGSDNYLEVQDNQSYIKLVDIYMQRSFGCSPKPDNLLGLYAASLFNNGTMFNKLLHGYLKYFVFATTDRWEYEEFYEYYHRFEKADSTGLLSVELDVPTMYSIAIGFEKLLMSLPSRFPFEFAKGKPVFGRFSNGLRMRYLDDVNFYKKFVEENFFNRTDSRAVVI